MAKENEARVAGSTGSTNSERMKKAAITRRVTAEKRSKLSGENDYAYSRLSSLRRSCDRLMDRILEGGTATGELLDACANLEGEIGKALFAE